MVGRADPSRHRTSNPPSDQACGHAASRSCDPARCLTRFRHSCQGRLRGSLWQTTRSTTRTRKPHGERCFRHENRAGLGGLDGRGHACQLYHLPGDILSGSVHQRRDGNHQHNLDGLALGARYCVFLQSHHDHGPGHEPCQPDRECHAACIFRHDHAGSQRGCLCAGGQRRHNQLRRNQLRHFVDTCRQKFRHCHHSTQVIRSLRSHRSRHTRHAERVTAVRRL